MPGPVPCAWEEPWWAGWGGTGGTLRPAHRAHLDSPTTALTLPFSSSRLEDVIGIQFCKWDLGDTSVHGVVGARRERWGVTAAVLSPPDLPSPSWLAEAV